MSANLTTSPFTSYLSVPNLYDRIVTNKLLMFGVIFLLFGILGIEVFLKLKK